MHDNRGAECDGLTAEHIKYAHPSLIILIMNLFNVMIKVGYVPREFGNGITIPISKNGDKSIASANDFRGITINPIISKLFETCLLNKLIPFFETSNRQYGFKKGLSCSQAIHVVKKTADYFNSQECTVNVATLDISKAFDKINHYKLFI